MTENTSEPAQISQCKEALYNIQSNLEDLPDHPELLEWIERDTNYIVEQLYTLFPKETHQ